LCFTDTHTTHTAKVGRFKINKKLGLDPSGDSRQLGISDITAVLRYLLALHAGQSEVVCAEGAASVAVETDDIDHFGNRRIRAVGELIQNQVRTGLSRLDRMVRERMTTQEAEAITPSSLINIRPIVAAIKEFFGTSQLSQFMDQNNPLAGLTHKRRLSALGPGGLSRDRAGMEVRDVHPSHYGRMCPIETPEGPNIGLIGSLASFARINSFGFIETPYRRGAGGGGPPARRDTPPPPARAASPGSPPTRSSTSRPTTRTAPSSRRPRPRSTRADASSTRRPCAACPAVSPLSCR